jgi:hypothetical protein
MYCSNDYECWFQGYVSRGVLYETTRIKVNWYVRDKYLPTRIILNICLRVRHDILHKWAYRNAEEMLISIFYIFEITNALQLVS